MDRIGSLLEINKLVSSANKISSMTVDTLFNYSFRARKTKGPELIPEGLHSRFVERIIEREIERIGTCWRGSL